MLYQSFLAKVSVFFLRPFFPFERRLFLPTAMIASLVVGRRGVVGCRRQCRRARIQRQCGVENLSEPSSASRVPRPHRATAIPNCIAATALHCKASGGTVMRRINSVGPSRGSGMRERLEYCCLRFDSEHFAAAAARCFVVSKQDMDDLIISLRHKQCDYVHPGQAVYCCLARCDDCVQQRGKCRPRSALSTRQGGARPIDMTATTE
jgi:hypothetical protein